MITILIMTILSLSTATKIYGVNYDVNDADKEIIVNNVNGSDVLIRTIKTADRENDDERFNSLHHFPGVASEVLFSRVDNNSVLQVLLANGTLTRVMCSRVCASFHTHNKRMIFGELSAFVVNNSAVADLIYTGAPIFRDQQLVSVVTSRVGDTFSVSGVRPLGRVSGHVNFDEEVLVRRLNTGMSVYGRKQLPYTTTTTTTTISLKQFAVRTHNNRRAYRNLPRSVIVFHNEHEVSVALVEGEFEMFRVRLNGPLAIA